MKALHFKKLALVSLVALLAGCGGSEQEISLDPVQGTANQVAETSGSVVMNFVTSNIPFPHDALFSGSTDGTLNIPVDDETNYADPTVALNALDGFSTSAPITFSLTKALDTTDANFNTIADVLETGVQVFKTVSDPATKAVLSVDGQLIPGVDYFPAAVDEDTIAILPLKPLDPKTTYLVVVNSQMLDADEKPLVRSTIYNGLASTESLVGSALEALEPLRQLTNAQLAALAAADVDVTTVVASWSFTTQSTSDVLTSVQASVAAVPNTSLVLQNTTFSTALIGGAGAAEIYAGTLTVPYYLTAPTESNPLLAVRSFWQGAGEGFLTQFNSMPVKTADVTIPVVMTKPLIGVKPAEGWPVVIFQHGATQNRGNVLAVADALAQAGYASIAIDMPLHGITPSNTTFAALRVEGLERTFDLNLVTENESGTIIATEPDTVIDSSGTHFINFGSLLTTRDNIRQAVSDLMQLKSALAAVAFGGDDAGAVNLLDESRVALVGHSLGAMVGGIFVDLSDDEIESAVFANPGVQAAYLLAASSAYGPDIESGLSAQGIEVGSTAFSQFLLATQTVIDSADPVNYVSGISSASLLFEVVGDGVNPETQDLTIPNRVATAPMAGTEPWIALQGLNAVTVLDEEVGELVVVTDRKGAIRFVEGGHSSLLLPDSVTVTMQEAMASFVATQGAAISVSDNSTIKQD